MMRANATPRAAARLSPSTYWSLKAGKGPRPASTHHQRLEVVGDGKANRDRPVVLMVAALS
jgi:hypothetical protein